MKTKTQRVLFLAIIVTGIVLPWATILAGALISGISLPAALGSVTAALPLWPLTVPLLAAWWALPFVIIAYLWRRLLAAEWRPLRREPLLIVLGLPVVFLSMAASEPVVGVYLLAFLGYGIVAMPSWGLRAPIGRALFALFGFGTLILFTLLNYGLLIGFGANLLRHHLIAPLGILGYMTLGLFIGYLFGKPIDLLITHGEPVPEATAVPRPSAWLIPGNAAGCGIGFLGVIAVYSRLAGSTVARHEIGAYFADIPVALLLYGLFAGAVIGIVVYFVALAMLRRDVLRRGNPVLDIGLLLLPGLLAGLAPGLLGERGVLQVLGSSPVAEYFGHGFDGIEAIAASPDGSRIAMDGGARLAVRDLASGQLLADIRYPPTPMPGFSGTLEWRMVSSAPAWSPDGGSLAVAAGDDRIDVLDGQSGSRLQRLDLPEAGRYGSAINGMAFSPDGRRLVVARSNGSILLFETAMGTLQRSWQSPTPTRELTAVAISPDGRRIAVAGISSSEANPMGGFVTVIDAGSGEALYTVGDFEQVADRLAFSADGWLLLLAGIDNPPRLLDATSGRVSIELRHHCPRPPPDSFMASRYFAAFLGAGRSVAVACQQGVVEVCDGTRGDCQVLLELQLAKVQGLAAHPDGRHILLVESGERTTLWDTLTAEPRQTYQLP